MLHPAPMRTLELAYTALKPGGIIIFDFKNIRSLSRQICIGMARMGLPFLLPRKFFHRCFRAIRFGMHRSHVTASCERIGFEVIGVRGKPPRLLAYENRNQYSRGLYGTIWRVLDKIDRLRKEEAWMQIVARKKIVGRAISDEPLSQRTKPGGS